MDAFKEQEYDKRFDISLWKKLLQFCKPYKKKACYPRTLHDLFGRSGRYLPADEQVCSR